MAKLKPGDKIGPFPYQIIKQLGKGQGNMSDVYLAAESDRPNAPSVVLKISRANSDHSDFFTDTIYNEAERLRQLSHPGIVRLLPIKTNSASMRNVPYVANASLPGRPWFLVLEHLAGGALDDILNKEKRLPQVLALRIAQRLAATLDYIHRCGQVHLDIKPENILFRHELAPDTLPDPVLIDFGIARNVGQEGLEARTLHYSPPERVLLHKSTLPLDALAKPAPSMDVYSLGVVLYQMLTGRRPYDGHNDKRISSAIISGNPTKPSVYVGDLDRDVEAIVLQAMEKDPAARPTAGEMAQRLEAIAVRKAYSEPQPGAPPVPAGSRPSRQSQQKAPQKAQPSSRNRSRSGQNGGSRRRTGLLVTGGVTLVGLALVGALVLGGGLPASAGPASGSDGVGGGSGIAAGAAAWWRQLAGMLPWLGGGNNGGSAGSGPVIAWQTATSAAATAPPTPIPPTSTPVPPHPTSTSTLEPTSTAAVRNTNTPTPPPTVTDTPTVKPTAPPTSTPAVAAATAQEVALAFTLTAAPTFTFTPTRVPPTSTPVGKDAGTAAPTKTATARAAAPSAAGEGSGQSTAVPDRPTNTPRPPTPTATAGAAATRPPATATPPKDVTPFDPGQATVRLIEPADGHTGHGAITFRWETPYQLQENQAFEPVFWRAGGDPMRDGRGYGGTTRGTGMTINWDEVNAAPDGYQWGVLLVETNPYKRIHYMGGGSGFQFTGPDNGGDAADASTK